MDKFLSDMLIEARKDKFMRLTPIEAKLVRKPLKFAEKATLDEKLVIASKLGKRIYIVATDDNVEINSHEFAKIFRYTFFSKERNDDAIELIEDKGVVVFGSETISRWMQRTELFLNSDLFELSNVVKRLKGKRGIVNFGFDKSDNALKDIFMHTAIRMYFGSLKAKSFVKLFALNDKEFSILSVIWLSARPMTNEGIRAKLQILQGLKVADIRASLKVLSLKKYIHGVPREATHANGVRTQLWMLTESGHECIEKFIRKVAEETMTNLYE